MEERARVVRKAYHIFYRWNMFAAMGQSTASALVIMRKRNLWI
jgi:hypothetical protein